MLNTLRHRVFFILTLAALIAVLVDSNIGEAAPTSAAPADPILTVVALSPRSIAVSAHGLTPGGQVYVVLYDVWGTRLDETRWTIASATVYGQDGSLDPAAGYFGGGTISERFDNLCGATNMVRAYDGITKRWSTSINVDSTQFGLAYYGPGGSADPAQGYVAGC